MKVRVATNEDGPRIGELAASSGFAIEGIDWSRVHPFWLVAERDKTVIGALQIILSCPIGWLEMLSIDPELSHIQRAKTTKLLVESGLLSLKRFGAQVAMWSVPFELKSYKKILKKRGAVVTSSGNVLAKVL